MKLSSMLNSAIVCAAKKDVRYYLNGVNIYYKEDSIRAIASTDGHTAQLLSINADESKNLAGYDNLIVSLDDAKRLIAIYNAEDALDISVKGIIEHIEPVDGRYPDISRIIPTEASTQDGELVLGADYKYLARVNASMTKLNKGYKAKYSHAKFTFNGAYKAIRVDADSADMSVKMLMVIMPCRL